MDTFKITQLSEISLTYRTKVAAKDRPKITCSKDAYNILYTTWDQDKIELSEEFALLLLNRSNHVLGKVIISKGTTSGTLVDLKFIIVAAAKANASGIILAHNHPSGNLKASQADISLTTKIKQACALIDVAVLNHIILTPHDGFTSFADQGQM